MSVLHYFPFLLLLFAGKCTSKNIVLIVADDLDSVLDGMEPLANTRKFIGEEGVTFDKAFAASPICCPNRASILTGKYQHNHGTYDNSLAGGCNGKQWQVEHENNTFAAILKRQQNYKTFYAGKYLNKYGNEKAGGVSRVPAGWDAWYGLVGNSKYYSYSLSINGKERKYGTSPNDYLTDVIKGFGLNFLRQQKAEEPFLMVLAPPAPHEPFTPAPRHNDKYKGKTAKRTPNFNTISQKDKHWLVRMGPSPLPSNVVKKLDEIYRRRWETLVAVDELVEAVYSQLSSQGLLNETYIIFTSDNGYHIGQFSQPYDKRQPYETDIRVPLLIRGPGIDRATRVNSTVSSVDLFATILDIAGIEVPSDGMSLLNYTVQDRTVLVEYKGEKSESKQSTGCPSDNDINLSHCSKDYSCKCQDVANNTYSCVRRVTKDEDNVFCVFKDNEDFVEFYDMLKDEFQMNNMRVSMGSRKRHRFRNRLKKMDTCHGRTCIATNPPLNIKKT
ncbi:N-acetylglucosamine-6-sulfatase-like [Trichogramma pretiosum]|uniref:N-acetylglucosamine-6-sulfatase-like n=1 Tax=Trichogramma pretiosum TaxID=7493 RepID=UPI0006C96602|nr:N-acetylglucosamine-6-sulfatase-like [Trichogramma pretiosum]